MRCERRLMWALVLQSVTVSTLTAQSGTGRSAWAQVLKACLNQNLVGEHILYFGPVSDVGVGSLWQRGNITYVLQHRVSDLPIANAPIRSRINKQCKTTVNINVRPSNLYELATMIEPAGDEIFSGSTWDPKTPQRYFAVNLSISSYGFETLIEQQYRTELANVDHRTIRDRLKTERFAVETRALYIKGFHAEITVGSIIGAALKRKLPDGDYSRAKLGYAASISWAGDTRLMITSRETLFLGGELAEAELGKQIPPFRPIENLSASPVIMRPLW